MTRSHHIINQNKMKQQFQNTYAAELVIVSYFYTLYSIHTFYDKKFILKKIIEHVVKLIISYNYTILQRL